MAKTARLEMRCGPELLERIDGVRGDVSRARWIERALESALSDLPTAPVERAPSAPPPRAPGVKTGADLMMDRQRRLNAKR
jgi:hypothetical protein